MSDTDSKGATPVQFDGGIASVMRAAKDIFGSRVSAVRLIAVYGDQSVNTEVILSPTPTAEDAA